MAALAFPALLALALAIAASPAPAATPAPASNPHAADPPPAVAATSKAGVPRPAMRWWPATAQAPRPEGARVDTIVLHHTVIADPADRTAGFFARPDTKVSAHYVVGKDGSIIQCVPDALMASHAGVSSYDGRERVNGFSIGIEIVNLGDGVDPYPDAQYAALARLMAYLMSEHGVGWERVTGHKLVARPAGRKNDPSPNFDYLRLHRETQAIAPQPGRLAPEAARNAQPAMPPMTDRAKRIAIVGGGVAGLAAAYELTRLGFRDVTIHEAADRMGGKVRTWAHPATGRPYEVGAIVQSDAFEAVYRLARETGYAERPADWLTPFPLAAEVVDRTGGVVSAYTGYHERKPGSAERYGGWDDALAILPFWRLGADLRGAGVEEPGFETLLDRAAIDPAAAALLDALTRPTADFLAERGLTALRGRFSLFFNMTGYGFASEVPALYHAKFLDMVAQVGQAQVVWGRSGMTNASRGYQALYDHLGRWLAAHGVKLRLGMPVLAVKRPDDAHWGDARPVAVTTPAGTADYDALLVATSPPAARGYLMDAAPLERRMLEAVKTYTFVTAIFQGSPAMVQRWGRKTVLVEDHALDAASAVPGAHVVGLYNNDGSDVFTAYQFARADASEAAIAAALKADVAALGGHVERVHVLQPWRDYFPHHDGPTLRSDGGRFLAEILDLQGERNTLFLTANYNFESTEHQAAFARRMVHRFFR